MYGYLRMQYPEKNQQQTQRHLKASNDGDVSYVINIKKYINKGGMYVYIII